MRPVCCVFEFQRQRHMSQLYLLLDYIVSSYATTQENKLFRLHEFVSVNLKNTIFRLTYIGFWHFFSDELLQNWLPEVQAMRHGNDAEMMARRSESADDTEEEIILLFSLF